MINKRIILISMGILAAAILVIVLIFSTEPTAQSEGATKESAMLVSTVPAKKGQFHSEYRRHRNCKTTE